MASALVKNYDGNSKLLRKVPVNNPRRFSSTKKKSRQSTYEKVSLICSDTDSNSDEEIVLHDIRNLRTEQDGDCQSYNLRKINKKSSLTNGDIISKSADPLQNCDFVYLEIQEGDSLQSISIKYQCSISDLKRANNIISSQEFFGLKHVKIPVKKFSLLTEILPDVPETKSNCITVEENDTDTRTINIGLAGRSPSPQDSAAFFKRMDEDLVQIILSTNTQKESLEAATVALTAPQIQPLMKNAPNTVDTGIQWNYLITIVIVIAIVIPTVIAVYMYMRPPHEHAHEPVSTESFSVASQMHVKNIT